MELAELAGHLLDALRAIDESRVPHKAFKPGVGPYGEPDLVRAAVRWLRKNRAEEFGQAVVRRNPDLFIPARWSVELKVVRPFGDNGKPAEHWSQNLLHPYPGNTSLLGDCLKLLALGGDERKAVVAIGFEHDPAELSLDTAFDSFEALAWYVLGVVLGERAETRCAGLCHPVHQVVRVVAWEVLGMRDLDE